MRLTRRRFLAVAAAGAGRAGLYTWCVEPHWLEIVVAGEFSLAGNRRLYISRGVGHLTQVRFNVRPEVTAFELRGA
jgi:predicted MPP superfamily phosphohydrolase